MLLADNGAVIAIDLTEADQSAYHALAQGEGITGGGGVVNRPKMSTPAPCRSSPFGFNGTVRSSHRSSGRGASSDLHDTRSSTLRIKTS